MEEDFQFDSSIYKQSRTIIHIDIDCFYAQCEMLKNPDLCDKPVGIKQKNYIITSNYVARKCGVQKCMLIPNALALCPQLVIVNGEDLYDYRKMSTNVTEVVKGFTSKVEKLGLDENFVDVSELVSARLQEEMQNRVIEFEGHIYKDIVHNKCLCGCNERLKMGSIIAKEIRDKIKDVLGLTCSAGIGHNKLVAKLVSSEHKPDQQTTILPSAVFTLMSSLNDVQRIPGIGRKTSDVLKKMNIKTIVDLQNCSLLELEKKLDKSSSEWILKSSFGIDDSQVKVSGKPQTLSVEDAVWNITTTEEVQAKFVNLIERLLILIREDGRLPTTLKITVREAGNYYTRESRQCSVNPNILNCEKASTSILEIAMQMFKSVIDQNRPFNLTLIGIGFTKFKEVYTGKKSIVSFFQKPELCKKVEVNDSREDKCNVTMCENTENGIDLHSSKYDEEVFKNQLSDGDMSTNIYGESTSQVFNVEKDVSAVSNSKELNNMNTSDFNFTDTYNQDASDFLICPEGVDEEVFSQLPADIQLELINNHKTPLKATTNFKDAKVNSLKKVNIKSKTLKKKNSLGQINKIQNYFSKS